MRLTLFIATIGVCAYAQTGTIEGIVRDGSNRQPLAGVQVALTNGAQELTISVTGTSGEFAFSELAPGAYSVRFRKAGYYFADTRQQGLPEEGWINVSVDADGRTPGPRSVAMFVPATLTGRVVDEHGYPMKDVMVDFGQRAEIDNSTLHATTDGEGYFTSPPLLAGPFLARIAGVNVKQSVLDSFTAEDAARVEEDLATQYWPGGFDNSASAVPAQLTAGSRYDLGTLRTRRMPLYRVRLQAPNQSCTDGFFIVAARLPVTRSREPRYTKMECAAEYLLTGLPAGRYRLRLSDEANMDDVRYALAEIEIGPDTRPVEMRLQPMVRMSGRLVAADGSTLEEGVRVGVVISPEQEELRVRNGGSMDAYYRFTLTQMYAVPSRVVVNLPPPYYAASIRLGGQQLPEGRLVPVHGAELEIVVDDKSATIAGRLRGRTDAPVEVAVDRKVNGRFETYMQRFFPGSLGTFGLPGLPPGEYSVRAAAVAELTMDAANDQVGKGTPVTVKRGQTVEIELTVR